MTWRYAVQRLVQPILFYPLQNAVSLLAQSHRTKHQILTLDFAGIQEESKNLVSSFLAAAGGGGVYQHQNASTPFKTKPTVSLEQVKAANAALSSASNGSQKQAKTSTAVFTGATRGLGLATLEAWAKYTPKPHAIIVGRNKEAFDPVLHRLRSINPNGTYTFLSAEASLITSIDNVCKTIHHELSSISAAAGAAKIDHLFLSQGFLNFSGLRQETPEGLDTATALRYYSRIRFIQNLLPFMSERARIVSILAGGMEGKIFESDLDLRQRGNYSLLNSLGHFTTLLTLTHDALASQHPSKSFLHIYPGFVNTGVLARSCGQFQFPRNESLGRFFGVVEGALSWVSLQPEEVGERMLFYATCERFGRGSWSLDWDGTVKEAKALKEYRGMEGVRESVLKHNERTFERVSRVI